MTTSAQQAPVRYDNRWEIKSNVREPYIPESWSYTEREKLIKEIAESQRLQRERKKQEKERKLVEQLTDPEFVARKYNMPLTDREFVDWLRGAVDLVGDEPPTKQQWDNIKSAIARVIAKRMLDIQEVEYNTTNKLTTGPSMMSVAWKGLPHMWSSGSAVAMSSANHAVASLNSEIAALKLAIANTEEETK